MNNPKQSQPTAPSIITNALFNLPDGYQSPIPIVVNVENEK